MTSKQLFALFFCSLIIWTVALGLTPLLPVYATQIGAEPSLVGYLLSLSQLTLTIGSVVAGWLSDRFQRRKTLLILGGVAGILPIWMMGRVTIVWQLILFTAIAWLFGGMGMTLLNILAGLFADEAERGRVFGILTVTSNLGAIIAGLTAGPIADRWGYPSLFSGLSLFMILLPITALFLEDKEISRIQYKDEQVTQEKSGYGGSFFLLILARLTVGIASFIYIISRSLVMDDIGLSSTAISSTGAISGLVSLPLPILLGWLSDRTGRKMLLIFCYFAGTIGLFVLSVSISLWHFWVVTTIWNFMYSAESVGSAMVTDLVPQESLGRGMALYVAVSGGVSGIIGFAVAGNLIQNLGMTSTLTIGAFLPMIAIVFLIMIRQGVRGIGAGSQSLETVV